jgi:hypothetical protein
MSFGGARISSAEHPVNVLGCFFEHSDLIFPKKKEIKKKNGDRPNGHR